MADFKLTPQDTITFLQEYIDAINDEIDSMQEGHDLTREIKKLKLRVELLTRVEGNPFNSKIEKLNAELAVLEEEYNKINPILESLDEERRYYRSLLNEVSR